MLTRPRWFYFYRSGHDRSWLFGLLSLASDVFMAGYRKDAKWGPAIYNLVHTLAGPLVLLGGSLALAKPVCIPYTLIWLAHSGMDRALGYGLKYPTFFKDTHLQHV